MMLMMSAPELRTTQLQQQTLAVKLQWIKEPPKEVVVSLNQELKVDCQAQGEPRPIVRWQRLASDYSLGGASGGGAAAKSQLGQAAGKCSIAMTSPARLALDLTRFTRVALLSRAERDTHNPFLEAKKLNRNLVTLIGFGRLVNVVAPSDANWFCAGFVCAPQLAGAQLMVINWPPAPQPQQLINSSSSSSYCLLKPRITQRRRRPRPFRTRCRRAAPAGT